jgi:membrane peptidoglycan carboxypeptidase
MNHHMFDDGLTNHEHDRSRRSIARAFGGLAIASVLAGVLVATSITPLVAVAGVGVRDSITTFESLPADIAITGTSQRNQIFGTRDGQAVKIADIYDQNREVLPWDDVSPLLKQAAIAAEDNRYYEHGGIDPQSLARAAFGYVTKSGDSGGSTITMQLVKNIRINESQQLPTQEERDAAYKEAIRTTPARKIEEMRLAMELEKKYTKDEILLAYLNVAAFGRATYGVEAASERYYSASAKDLTLAQAASLIAMVQEPNALNLGAVENYPKNLERRDFILNNMLELGQVTPEQHAEAIATPVEAYVALQEPTNGCLYATSAKFFCDYVVRNVPFIAALGADEAERAANWKRGGYKVYTSLDLGQQDVAQEQLDARAPADESRFALGAAAVSVEPGSGRIFVMAQNKGFNNTLNATAAETSVNFSTDAQFGGSAGFQTGSIYKIFTLVKWLQEGHTLRETVNGSPRTFSASSFKCYGATGSGDAFPVGNDTDGYGGSQTVLNSIAKSINGSFVSMAQKLDLCEIRDLATSMGAHRADGKELEAIPASVLGVNQSSPLAMASSVATIAANGVYCEPIAVDKIVDAEGNDLGGQAPTCGAVLEPNVAATTAYALESVFTSGTATSANARDGVPVMGKTGTTDGSYQNWLVGSTTKTAIAVWVGNIQGNMAKATTKNPGGEQSLRRVTVGGTNGANVKFVVFKAMLQAMNANPERRGADFPEPDPALVSGRRTTNRSNDAPVTTPPATSRPPATTPSAPPTPAPEPSAPAPGNGNGNSGDNPGRGNDDDD